MFAISNPSSCAKPEIVATREILAEASRMAQRTVERRKAAVLDTLPAHLALLEPTGTIRSVYRSWRLIGQKNGLLEPKSGVGSIYLDFFRLSTSHCNSDSDAAGGGIHAVPTGELGTFELEYPCHSPTKQRWNTQLLGRNAFSEFPATVGGPVEREFRRSVETQAVCGFEGDYEPLKSWFKGGAYPSKSGLGIYFRDVSCQRGAQVAIRLSDERFRLLGKATRDAVWDWDLASGACWWNEGLDALFGYRIEEFDPGRVSWERRVHPADREVIVSKINDVSPGPGQNWNGEYHFARMDGSYAFVLDRGYVIRDVDGGAVRMIGAMTDLTERKQEEERLREQAMLLDATSDAILVRGLDDRFLYWNKGAERTYGWSEEEALIGLALSYFSEDVQAFRDATQATVNTGEWAGELAQISKDGRKLITACRWTLLRDADGLPKSILAIESDFTERRKLELQFLQVKRLESLGVFAGGIAHDLNNVLAPILMAVELLQLMDEDSERGSVLSTIEASAQRGADMLKQVLSFARGVEGHRIQVDLRGVVSELEHILRETFPKNVTLRTVASESLWSVLGDPTQLHQVVLNLAVNSRDAMPDGGVLRITLSNTAISAADAGMYPQAKRGECVLIEVADIGQGISPQAVDSIFDPFFTTKEVGKGTGLGLATTLLIIKSHGGFINVHSETGCGATFKVYLPASAAAGSVEARPPKESPLPRGHGELVLVVDDGENIRQVVRKTLERSGYRLLLAENGEDALAQFTQQRGAIALVLTDMMMPGMDRPALIAALRSLEPP